MGHLADRVRTRIAPALLTALGVTLLAAGVLSFATPAVADPLPTPSSEAIATTSPAPSPRLTLPPIGSVQRPTPEPTIPEDRVVSRIRIAALKIDLPVIRSDTVPCNVALQYFDARLGQPGEGKSVYLYSHAQAGMFLPLLTASKVSNGAQMKGMVAEVWTSDDQRFLYVITKVMRHVNFDEALPKAFAVKSDELWLQTSEGAGIQDKLVVVGELLSQETADHATANPTPHPKDPSKVKSGGITREICT